jgi:hypothetical protein
MIACRQSFCGDLEALIGQKYGLKIYGSSIDEISPPRPWKRLLNLFIAPLPTTVRSKKKAADRAVCAVGNWDPNSQ